MKTESEIRIKLLELRVSLIELESKFFKSKRDKIFIEFYKNNIAFIKWALNETYYE